MIFSELEELLGKTIWNTSRKDEGTISATGAKIVARAVIKKLREVGLLDPAPSPKIGDFVMHTGHGRALVLLYQPNNKILLGIPGLGEYLANIEDIYEIEDQ